MVIWAIASITVTAAIVSLWMKHVSSRFLPVQQKSPDSSCSSSTSEMTLWDLSLFSLWLGPVLSFYSAFVLLSYISSLVGNGGTCFCSVVVVVCSPPLFTVWVWSYLTRWEQILHLHGGGGLLRACAREWLTLPRHAPWLWSVVLIQERWILTNQITYYSHWVELQTADLYLILLSDHNNNFSKYNQKNSYRVQL